MEGGENLFDVCFLVTERYGGKAGQEPGSGSQRRDGDSQMATLDTGPHLPPS